MLMSCGGGPCSRLRSHSHSKPAALRGLLRGWKGEPPLANERSGFRERGTPHCRPCLTPSTTPRPPPVRGKGAPTLSGEDQGNA